MTTPQTHPVVEALRAELLEVGARLLTAEVRRADAEAERDRLRAGYDLALTMLLERGVTPSEFDARLASPIGEQEP